MKMKTYQLRMSEQMNCDIKVASAKANLTMQDWITKAVMQKLQQDAEIMQRQAV